MSVNTPAAEDNSMPVVHRLWTKVWMRACGRLPLLCQPYCPFCTSHGASPPSALAPRGMPVVPSPPVGDGGQPPARCGPRPLTLPSAGDGPMPSPGQRGCPPDPPHDVHTPDPAADQRRHRVVPMIHSTYDDDETSIIIIRPEYETSHDPKE